MSSLNHVKTVELLKRTIPCEALKRERVTTIPKGSTIKWWEAHGTTFVVKI